MSSYRTAARLMVLAAAVSAAAAPSCGLPVPGPCYVGYSFKRLPEIDARGCCEACAAAPTCAAWEIRSDQGDLCILKDDSHAPVHPGGAGNCSSSGTNGPPPPPGPPSPPAPPAPPSPPAPPAPPAGGPRFNDMFHGGAVLQRNTYVSVWGLSSEKTVSLSLATGADANASDERSADVSLTGAVNASGVWLLWLPPQPAAYNRSLTVVDASGQSTVVVSFGEAILCVGQVRALCRLALVVTSSAVQPYLRAQLCPYPTVCIMHYRMHNIYCFLAQPAESFVLPPPSGVPVKHGDAGGSIRPWV